MSILDQINNPNEIKKISKREKKELAQEVRDLIIEVSKNKDLHFSSNLGIVELTIALLSAFDAENDFLLFDTGHQTYPYKILTDRKDKFYKIKDEMGISGLMNMNESKYDKYSPGHSGNILSIASGIYQKQLEDNLYDDGFYKNKNNIVTIIGDSAFANGLTFEALNDVSYNKEPIIIVLNDNNMSISKPVGSISNLLTKTRRSNTVIFIEKAVRFVLKTRMYKRVYNLINLIQWRLFGKNFFEHLGFEYIGSIDGHNIKKMELAFKKAKWLAKKGPVIIHVKTKKGKGYEEAENDQNGKFHSLINNEVKTYGMHVTDKLIKLMAKDKNIRVINPAMSCSSNCDLIIEKYPKRFIDVGIAEEHALSKASGMALANLKPYVFIYSTFLQRAYDQLLHDFSRLKLGCTLLIDRCDLAGAEGSSHHGIFDIAFLKTLHHQVITMPRNIKQLNQLMDISIKQKNNLFCIRYPKTDFLKLSINEDFRIVEGKWEHLNNTFKNNKTVIISYGPFVNVIYNAINNKHHVDVINAIYITNYDQSEIKRVFEKYQNIIIYERIFGDKGLASDFYKYKATHDCKNKIHTMNYHGHIEFGSMEYLDKKQKMSINDIIDLVKKVS